MPSLTYLLTALAFGATVSLGYPHAPNEARQDPNPNGPAEGWTDVGCFTDPGVPRTLLESTFSSPDMTPALCTTFCGTNGFGFAGVEFASECFCGFTIQDSGVPADAAECNINCSGDATLTCGGASRVFVFTNGQPGPANKPAVGTWDFKGCWTDTLPSVSPRTLFQRLDVPAPFTIESCTDTCGAAGFSVAGAEFGQECWCGDFALFGTLAPNQNDCSMTCTGDHTEFCGSSFHLSVYQDSSVPVDFSACFQTQRFGFTLNGILKADASTPFALKVIDVGPTESSFFILSACDTCDTPWDTLNVDGSVLTPLPPTGPLNSDTKSFTVNVGDSPSFINSATPPSEFNHFCTMANPGNPVSPVLSPLALGASNHADLWAICPNSTADGRLDVVFSPIADHPHYTLTDCQDIFIQVI